MPTERRGWMRRANYESASCVDWILGLAGIPVRMQPTIVPRGERSSKSAHPPGGTPAAKLTDYLSSLTASRGSHDGKARGMGWVCGGGGNYLLATLP
jgi:hypothetical protein